MRGRTGDERRSGALWLWAGIAALAFAIGLLPPLAPAVQADPLSTAKRAQVSAGADQTVFTLDLTAGVTTQIFTLADPYRVIIDLPDVTFALPPQTGETPGGVITGFRFGALAPNKARIVIETVGPIEIAEAGMTNIASGKRTTGVRLHVALKPMDAAAFGKGTGFDRASGKLAPHGDALQPVKPAVFDDGPPASQPHLLPVIMIDPGHGGIDPGAIGVNKTLEKSVVLAVALSLKAALEQGGHYDVRLTRANDVFVPLDKRVELSRHAGADIFLSLHADTIEDHALARTIRGASIYTLSDKASNEEARLMAEKENAADLAAGLAPSAGETSDGVKPILFDLLARETATYSRLLSRSLVAAMSHHQPLAHEPERAAAFRVLRQANAPSVLIELGFLSNPTEEQVMTGVHWQKQVASAIAAAIDTYFARKSTSTATAPLGVDFGGLPP